MNLQSTLDIYAGGPGSGCNPDVGKCGRPQSARSLNKAPVETIGRTKLAYNAKAAVEAIVGQLRAHWEPEDWYDRQHPGEVNEEKMVEAGKNWAKTMKGAFGDKVTPEVLEDVRQGIQDNESNPLFKRMLEKYGGDAVVVRQAGTVELKTGRLDNDMPQAERSGFTSHVFVGSVFSDTKPMPDAVPIAPILLPIKDTGVDWVASSQSFGGIAAVLRHEYGHSIYNLRSMSPIDSVGNRFYRAYNKYDQKYVATHITAYAAERAGEAFAEMFAIRTSRNFDQKNFPGMDDLWAIMDEVVK